MLSSRGLFAGLLPGIFSSRPLRTEFAGLFPLLLVLQGAARPHPGPEGEPVALQLHPYGGSLLQLQALTRRAPGTSKGHPVTDVAVTVRPSANSSYRQTHRCGTKEMGCEVAH